MVLNQGDCVTRVGSTRASPNATSWEPFSKLWGGKEIQERRVPISHTEAGLRGRAYFYRARASGRRPDPLELLTGGSAPHF